MFNRSTLSRSKPLLVAGLSALLIACGADKTADLPAKELYNNAMEYTVAKDSKYDFNLSGTMTGLEEPMLQSIRFTMAGAADNSALKYEIRPEISMPIMQIKLPVLIDVKQEHLLIDGSSVVPMAAMLDQGLYAALNKYENKITRITSADLNLPPEALAKKDAAIELISILMSSSIEASKTVAEDKFKKITDNEKAKTLKAAALVELTLDAADAKAMNQQMNQLIVEKVKASNKISAEDKAELLPNIEQALAEQAGEAYQLHTLLYLNDKQQPIHQEAKYSFELEDETVNLNVLIDYSNFGKPTFTLDAKGTEFVDFNMMDFLPLMMMAP